MKVLFLTPHITILDDKKFTKNITGLGHMVRDIADYISRTGIEVDLVTMSAITNGRRYNSITILKRTWTDILLHIKPYYFKRMMQLISNYRPSCNRTVKVFYYFLSGGYVEHIIKRGNYDLVHIHGIGFVTKPYIDCCERLGIEYLVTLHGLNSFSDSVRMELCEKQYEKDFLRYAYENSVPLTVISTGILNVVKSYLSVKSAIKNIFVITNGTDVNAKSSGELDIRQKYAISKNKRIMLCVGNLSANKNQLKIIRSYALLPLENQNHLCILFLGKADTSGEFEREISQLGLEKNLILCGNISREEISSYYQQADYTVLASISEGFGLSIIEGYVYGLPNLTFADLDAIEDLYDEKAMLILTERSNQAMADGIIEMLSKDWDKEYIKQYSKRFSLELMAREYVKVYQEVVG